MAALASSAVTINKSWLEQRLGSMQIKCREVTLVLTGQGGTTNTIPASVLGLTSIEEVSNAVSDGNTIYPCAPSYDGTAVIVSDAASATAANHINAADLTDTVRLIVKGY